MKNVIALIGLSLMFTSCVSLDGKLEVKEAIQVKKKGGFLNLKRKLVTLEPGIYTAEVNALGEKNFNLKLTGRDNFKIPLQTKKDIDLPRFDGEFKVAGADLDQPFDVKGNLDTKIDISETREKEESCSYTVTEQRCEKVCVVTNDVRKCDVVCNPEYITKYGYQYVRYHMRTTKRFLDLELLALGSDKVLASFSGDSYETNQINEYVGICR